MEETRNSSIEINGDFQTAFDLIVSGRSVFITGRAGTGKSTLLNHLVSLDDVPQVVLAPTGVAALNVNGQTIHRFFGFPQSVTPEQVESGEIFPHRNIGMIRSVRRIIIDEVSMVRADLMDSVDAALRRHGPDPARAFGGIQMVFVGDPFQLPPVVEDDESEYFATKYQTPFFFSSHALSAIDVDTIELGRIYRQTDDEFISILNAIRNNTATPQHFDRLNENVDADFIPTPDDPYITLATTNRVADRVNGERLAELEGEEFQRVADVTGEFSLRPTSADLRFKVGAQVMMLTNDPTDRWVNGSLGMIIGVRLIDDFEVSVLIYDTGEIVLVEPHRWSVSQPRMEAGRLLRDDVGSFCQLPFALAWAITIHKSQGKTFDRVIIDLGGGTRSTGQLYVALSRARSLDGIVLRQQIRPKHVLVEDEVSRFFARQRGGSRPMSQQRLAAVATNVTGHGQYDRIVEIAVVIVEGGRVVDEFDTMVHPLRDVTGSWEHGISATMASMAPSFSEVWAAISPHLEGCVLVAHGLAPISRQVRQEFMASNMLPGSMGLGICSLEQTRSSLLDACTSRNISFTPDANALARARATAELAVALGDLDSTFEPMTDLVTGSSPPRLQRRPGQRDDLVRSIDHRSTVLDPEAQFAGLLARFLDDGRIDEHERTLLDRFAHDLGLPPEVQSTAYERFCTSLVEAAARDEEVDHAEWEYITSVHGDLGIDLPTRPPARPDQVVDLFKGMQVCFTGFPLDGPDGYFSLVAVARSIGLEEVRDVSSRRGHLLVALDRASISRRAKKARELGIPLIDVTAFLDLVERGELVEPPEPVERPSRGAGRSSKDTQGRPKSAASRPTATTKPEDFPKNRPASQYTLEQLVAVVELLDPERSLDDTELLNRCITFLEFDLRTPQRVRKIASAIDTHRGEEIGSFRARQSVRSTTATASDLTTPRGSAADQFVPKPGMGICFTGAAVINGEKVVRKVLQEAAARAGLNVLDSVTSDCHVLVFADENARSTKKVKKALEMGIEGMTVERFAEIFLPGND